MSNLLNRLEQRQMPTRDVAICLDLNLLAERDKAMAAVAGARRSEARDQRMAGENPDLAQARAALDDVEARIKAASLVIRITGVDRLTYSRFLMACPPRKGRQESYDSSKFFMHVARNTGQYVDEHGEVHEITAEEWAAIDKAITDGEHGRIAKAIVEVNQEVGGQNIAFLGSGSATTADSAETSG